MRIDLHSHSSLSDGRDSVEEVFAAGAKAQLDVLALTDHDTTAGWGLASVESLKQGISFVPGIELTTTTKSGVSVHLLAYLPDADNSELQKSMAAVKERRATRIHRFIENLQEPYPNLTLEQVMKEADAKGKAMGRPHIADALIELGHFGDRSEAFDGPLSKNSEYYVANDGIPTVEAVRLVRAAGGVPIMAHPLSRRNQDFEPHPKLREHFMELVEAGLAGFEVFHREVSEGARVWLLEMAKEFDLVVTGSSDYHGDSGKPNRLGENTTSLEMLRRIEQQATGTTIRWI